VTDNIYCLVIIIAKNDSNIAAVQFKIKLNCIVLTLNISSWFNFDFGLDFGLDFGHRPKSSQDFSLKLKS